MYKLPEGTVKLYKGTCNCPLYWCGKKFTCKLREDYEAQYKIQESPTDPEFSQQLYDAIRKAYRTIETKVKES